MLRAPDDFFDSEDVQLLDPSYSSSLSDVLGVPTIEDAGSRVDYLLLCFALMQSLLKHKDFDEFLGSKLKRNSRWHTEVEEEARETLSRTFEKAGRDVPLPPMVSLLCISEVAPLASHGHGVPKNKQDVIA